MKNLAAEIDRLRRQIAGKKPRAKRRVQLEARLREVRLKQLRAELRAEKRGSV